MTLAFLSLDTTHLTGKVAANQAQPLNRQLLAALSVVVNAHTLLSVDPEINGVRYELLRLFSQHHQRPGQFVRW